MKISCSEGSTSAALSPASSCSVRERCIAGSVSMRRSFTAVNGCNISSHGISSVSPCQSTPDVYTPKISRCSEEESWKGDEDEPKSAVRNGNLHPNEAHETVNSRLVPLAGSSYSAYCASGRCSSNAITDRWGVLRTSRRLTNLINCEMSKSKSTSSKKVMSM